MSAAETPPSRVHETAIAVTWGDCDAAGIVFYPRYFAWFDTGTHGLLGSVGLGVRALRRDLGVITPLVASEASFKRSASWDDRLLLRSQIVRWGRSSFVLRHVLTDAEGAVVADGTETRAWVEWDDETNRPRKARPIPQSIRDRLTGAPEPVAAD